jgi:hypothetical protein
MIMSKYWKIEAGKVDSNQFFDPLAKHFPTATTLFVEGTSISEDVQQWYELHRQEGVYLPEAQTLWPTSKKFRCNFSPKLMAELSSLSRAHAEPELLDHLALYKGEEELLLWPDAFDNILQISKTVPESVVAAFAGVLGLRYV